MRVLSLLLLAGMYACTSSTAGDTKHSPSSDASSPKVLLELFTSQGCSSCPSADKLVSGLAQQDTNLIVLSFHVDYWDRLGWKDVFSNHQYTERQQQYAQALHAESVYTPQAIVGGQYEMVGSNKNSISTALQKVRSEANNNILSANAGVNNNVITVHYDINKTADHQQIAFALVQTNASTNVVRGENSGVQLTGYNVVRDFITMPLLQQSGTTEIKLPADLHPNNASVIVFVQDSNVKKVVAATNIKL